MKAGDHVICVNDQHWPYWAEQTFNKLPKKGKYYRVRRVIPNLRSKGGPDGIAVDGIFGEWDYFMTPDGKKVFEECHFRKDRFRVVTKDDMGKSVLKKVKEKRKIRKGISKKITNEF